MICETSFHGLSQSQKLKMKGFVPRLPSIYENPYLIGAQHLQASSVQLIIIKYYNY